MSISVGDRLKQLSGMSGATVATMLLAIGSGATVGDTLKSYSELGSGHTVAEHLLARNSYCDYIIHHGRRRHRR